VPTGGNMREIVILGVGMTKFGNKENEKIAFTFTTKK